MRRHKLVILTIVVLVASIVCLATSDSAASIVDTSSADGAVTTNLRDFLIGAIGGVIGGAAVLIAVKRQHSLELDRIYLAPFRKWCAELNDELYEINNRYLTAKAQKLGYSHIPDIQVIDDWRALHDVLAYGMGWLAKIRKEQKNRDLWRRFEGCAGEMDTFWHDLETRYQFVLQGRKDIIALGLTRQRDVADEIQRKGPKLLLGIDVDGVISYLEEKIPEG